MSSDDLVFDADRNVFEVLFKQLASLGKLIIDGKRGAWRVADVLQGLLTSFGTCSDAPKSDEQNIFERLFKLSVFIAKLLVDGKRDKENVAQVLQAIVDAPGTLFVTAVDVYSSNATPEQKMQRPQSSLYRKCLIDLRLWKPFKVISGRCGYLNFTTGDSIDAWPLNEQDKLVYEDKRITALMEKYGLGHTWWDRSIYTSEGIPLEVECKVS
jgi:hypothetical protein